eukprot:gnl/TRDRNA2_/TRDRNA2_131047_c0_seq2.p1 gnl/TRDRNA2_/TRDRNA2_131047_c0~~gnl/TRDRNA2_/TRDRNA2_131047_c0_seq2.p1  ORF type:complete len:738 (+),score=242.83 gnl/TRDRNA2_/TRDRNA2_131047_c0_seq2:27-2216(+)
MTRVLILTAIASVALATVSVEKLDAAEGVNPVTKVVRILEEMKEQVEDEAKEDQEIYEKYECWCTTNDKEKTAAIKAATKSIERLTSAIEEGSARSAQLTNEISTLKDEIASNVQANNEAAGIRAQEKEEYEQSSSDMFESLNALKLATEKLGKVNLLQTKPMSLMQKKSLVSKVSDAAVKLNQRGSINAPRFTSVMRRDLWDMLSVVPDPDKRRAVTSFTQETEPTGAAAGASSYSPASAQIFGLLNQMKDKFSSNLADAQKEELLAEVSYQKQRAAKQGEINADTKSLEDKSAELADTNQKVAQARADLEDTQAAKASDEAFLADLKVQCKKGTDEYNTRSSTRLQEIAAIGETIGILTDDDARNLFSSTMSFLEMKSVNAHAQKRGHTILHAHARSAQVKALSAKLREFAKKHKGTWAGWSFANLAVNVELDDFTFIKKIFDKMETRLRKEQQEEFEWHEQCKEDLKQNELAMLRKKLEQNDVEAHKIDLESTIDRLKNDLEELSKEIADIHLSLARAGEDRKTQNHEFQQVVSDQRATQAILSMALKRMKAFYEGPKSSLLALKARAHQEPGAEVEAPPPSGKAYKNAGQAPGVLQMLEKINQDAAQAESMAVAGEQEAQEAYQTLVTDSNAVLDANEEEIGQKTVALKVAEGDHGTAKQDLDAVMTRLENLNEQSQALHNGCDFLIKNYNVRQEARQDEIAEIEEAQQLLSGAANMKAALDAAR